MKHIGSLILFLAAAATATAAYLSNPESLIKLNSPLAKFFLVLAVILIANFITAIGVWALKKYAKSKEKSETKQITSVFRYVVFIMLLFVIAGILYSIIGPAITSIGLLAAGLTLALQRPIMNMGGWFLIVTKKPYRIGDRVDIGSISGFVHEISLMHTHLSMVDKEEPTGKVVYVPNEQSLTQPIVNYTKGSALVWDSIKLRAPITADAKRIEARMAECAKEVIGKEMQEAAKQWKVELKPEARTHLEYINTQPYMELSIRYLCNAKAITTTKTEITRKVIAALKKDMESWKK